MIDEIQVKDRNTATRACVLYPIRKATDCYARHNGAQFASTLARARKDETGKAWHQCGLVKEHVIPVSLIRELVVRELDRTRRVDGAPGPLELSADDVTGLAPRAITLFQSHPRAWQVGRIIRQWTVLCWVTQQENNRFDDKPRHRGVSLRKRMPIGWTADGDRFARYTACEIEYSPT